MPLLGLIQFDSQAIATTIIIITTSLLTLAASLFSAYLLCSLNAKWSNGENRRELPHKKKNTEHFFLDSSISFCNSQTLSCEP